MRLLSLLWPWLLFFNSNHMSNYSKYSVATTPSKLRLSHFLTHLITHLDSQVPLGSTDENLRHVTLNLNVYQGESGISAAESGCICFLYVYAWGFDSLRFWSSMQANFLNCLDACEKCDPRSSNTPVLTSISTHTSCVIILWSDTALCFFASLHEWGANFTNSH